MKLLLICFDDYANLMYNHCEALKSVGINAECFKRRSHVFAYNNEAPLATINQMQSKCISADVVIVYHSWNEPFKWTSKKQKRVVVHTGTTYRLNPVECNEYFNMVCDVTLTDQSEFLHLGAKNIHYIAAAINTDELKPIELKRPENLVIGHYPSNPTVKGTDKIKALMEVVKVDYPNINFHCDTNILPHYENLQRIRRCDIYIELFNNFQHGKEYGVHGVTAFEAAAMGCVVVTQNTHEQVYRNAYGQSPFFIANTEEKFLGIMQKLVSYNRETLSQLKELSVDIMSDNHSMVATGKRLLKLLNL